MTAFLLDLAKRKREAIKAAISGSPPQKVSPTAAAQETRTTKADERAAAIYPLILDIKTSGATSLRAIAKELTKRGVSTPSGRSTWHPQQVKLVIKRITNGELSDGRKSN